ncbi:GTPase Era involved in 16S rRNA processing [Trueperella bonasi]|uniref:GTPase Era involved in 16S rRNA processing n=1 Tax=Trueperella bonasi TaxID=312286 RepID=A0ABT9NHJ2_9ACTO|nr:GTP-binding protein [Trueperella bonasi]MDP9806867.1 GTPase Era involved in 16S rRNA processing [Trueperella bonasi]
MDTQSSHEVIERLQTLKRAVATGGRYFDPYVASRAQDDLRRTQERMRLGIDTTVAALVGGTGSGKSTMFNAITELSFADSGDIRPTTERAAACTFNVDAEELLDYLEVDEDRRIEHSSILTAGKDNLDGLVLLDLPDHDSVKLAHSAQVDRLLPMVDLLVWIVDPQKYADQVLHQDFLAGLAGRQDAMVVVMNQIDRIPEPERATILGDLRKLLNDDGLERVPIISASALTGEGVSEVRAKLAEAVRGQSINAQTAAAELDAIAARLRENLGEVEPDFSEGAVNDINDRIVRASGIPSVVESIRMSGESYQAPALVVPEQPANTMVHAIRDAWVAYVRQGLPHVWQEAVVSKVSSADKFRRELGNAIRTTPLPSISRAPAIVGLVLLVVLVLGCVAVAVFAPWEVPVRIGVGVGAALVGVIAMWLGRRAVKSSAHRAAERYDEAIRNAVAKTTDEHLIDGPRGILEQHRVTRTELSSEVFYRQRR